MARKTKQQITAEKAQAALLARPFTADSTAPYGAMPEAEQREVAKAIANAKASGASGDEMRARFGEKLTGPARRKVLRAFGFTGREFIAPSYGEYRDGDTRVGTRHAREHGALAQARRAEAREAAQAELAAATKSKKGRTKAERAAYAARVAQAEENVALFS
jgi:hypothetical protein